VRAVAGDLAVAANVESGAMSEALVADQVSRTLGRTQAVRAVSLTLHPGVTTALLGPSGAGKTTLLRLFAGFEPVDAGEIRAGETVLSAPGMTLAAAARRIGLVFQDFALFAHMSALKNVAFGLAHLPPAQRAETARHWLGAVGLADRADAFPAELSGGEQQRVAIARALAPAPRALLMDEAFSGLDPVMRASVRAIALGAIRDNAIPALLVTHDPAEALAAADRIAIMSRGELVQEGAAATVWRHPVNTLAAEALGPVNHLRPGGFISALRADAASAHTVLLRPEGLRIDPGAPVMARVISARGAGPMAEAVLAIGQETVTARGLGDGLAAGDSMGVAIDPAQLFIFGSGGS
jgi:iron(III) transport system ATP-binding protein